MNSKKGLYAIDMDKIDSSLVNWDSVKKGIDPYKLPKIFVSDPEKHANDAAIISWRWDLQHFSGFSINIALILLHAKEIGLRYLFMDIISVDQTLPQSEILENVIKFGDLFEKIPVLAAYDEPDKDFKKWPFTLRRPWILFEVRIYSTNPTKITYIGYRGHDKPRMRSFENEVFDVRRETYATQILNVLRGLVDMYAVRDFILIFPEFESVLTPAFEKLSQNDYLLTTFLLCASYTRGDVRKRDGKTINYGYVTNLADTQFDRTEFVRYSYKSVDAEIGKYESSNGLFLNDKLVAICRTKMTSSFNQNWVEVLPTFEELIVEVLGLPEKVKKKYFKKDKKRRTTMTIDDSKPEPQVSEKIAVLDKGCWAEKIPDPQGKSSAFFLKKK